MINLTELDKLEEYLKDHHIQYVRYDEDPIFKNGYVYKLDRHQIIVNNGEWDAICHTGSYGYKDGLLEVMGSTVVRVNDTVEGWLTAKEIIRRLQENDHLDGSNKR